MDAAQAVRRICLCCVNYSLCDLEGCFCSAGYVLSSQPTVCGCQPHSPHVLWFLWCQFGFFIIFSFSCLLFSHFWPLISSVVTQKGYLILRPTCSITKDMVSFYFILQHIPSLLFNHIVSIFIAVYVPRDPWNMELLPCRMPKSLSGASSVHPKHTFSNLLPEDSSRACHTQRQRTLCLYGNT